MFNKILGIGTITLFGTIGISIVGIELFYILLGFLGFFMFVDILMGISKAHINKEVESFKMIQGLSKKMINISMIMFMTILSGFLVSKTGYNYIGIIPLVLLSLFIFAELISILENYILLKGGNIYEDKIIKVLIKIFGLTFNKILKESENIATEKVESFIKTNSTNTDDLDTNEALINNNSGINPFNT